MIYKPRKMLVCEDCGKKKWYVDDTTFNDESQPTILMCAHCGKKEYA